MNRKPLIGRLTATLALVLCLGAFALAFGQLDPEVKLIYQNGQKVGVIYVPARPSGATLYAQHWILYPNYVYSGGGHNVKTEIVPDLSRTYNDDADFFRTVEWGPGFLYVSVANVESTNLPGRYPPDPY